MSQGDALRALEDAGHRTCQTCPKLCIGACPVAEVEARDSVSPHSLVQLAALVKEGELRPADVDDLPFHCTQCGACSSVCEHHNDVRFLIMRTRRRMRKASVIPPSVMELCGRFGLSGNPMGFRLEKQLDWVCEEAGVKRSRAASQVYFPGCETLAFSPDAAVALLRGAALRGLDWLGLSDLSAQCCGLPLLWAGETDGFIAHARRFASAARDIDVLYVHDAFCASALRERYADVGVALVPRVEHVLSLFERDSGGSTLSSAKNEPNVVLHMSSCCLAHDFALAEGSLAALASVSGIRVVPGPRDEFGAWAADCCGAGGLMPLVASRTSRDMATAWIDRARAVGASEIAVFSPRCAAHVSSVGSEIRVFDTSRYLART